VHLSLELLLLTIHRRLPAGRVADLLHRHLVEVCPDSAAAWEVERSRRGEDASPFAASSPASDDPLAPLPDDPNEIDLEAADAARRDVLAQVHEVYRRARGEVSLLRGLPRDERMERVVAAGSKVRFRTRALAELLLAESRRKAATEPDEAAGWAALAAEVGVRIPGAEAKAWAKELVARAEATRRPA
jgi:hypothetical protein